MPSTTIFSATSDGYLQSEDTTGSYSAARAGTGDEGVIANTAGVVFRVGQTGGVAFRVWESFINFDVSSLSDAASIDSATLSLWLTEDDSITDFTLQARSRNWGDTLETSDWVAGDSLSSLTLLASISSSGIGATGAYKALTSEAALLTAIESAIAGDGILRLLLCSGRTADNNEPTDTEFLIFSSADEAGTTQDPKLDITYTVEDESSSSSNSSSPSSESSASSGSSSSSSASSESSSSSLSSESSESSSSSQSSSSPSSTSSESSLSSSSHSSSSVSSSSSCSSDIKYNTGERIQLIITRTKRIALVSEEA